MQRLPLQQDQILRLNVPGIDFATAFNKTWRMNILFRKTLWLPGVLLLTAPWLAAQPDDLPLGNAWKPFFTNKATLVSMTNLPPNCEAFSVIGPDKELLGWAFRTDKVPPVIKGKRGEIGMLVAVSTNRTILGVSVLSHKEDQKWFRLLKPSFYAGFKGRPADKPFDDIHTITGATISSRAIIQDILQALGKILTMVQPAGKDPKAAE
jgi:hypothetical protein